MTSPPDVVSGHYAGPFTRLVAFLIDSVAVLAIYSLGVAAGEYLMDLLFGVTVQTGSGWVVGLLLWALVYFGLGTAISGKTIGKGLVGLKIVASAGDPVSLGKAFGRAFALPLSIAPAGLGLLGIVVGRHHRALHDVLAGTAVVYDWGDRPAVMPAALGQWLRRNEQ